MTSEQAANDGVDDGPEARNCRKPPHDTRQMLLIHHIRRKDGVEHAKRASTNPLDDTTDQHISPALRKEAQNPPSCEYQQSRKQNRHSPDSTPATGVIVASANVKQTTTMPASAMLRPNVRAIAGMTGRISVTPIALSKRTPNNNVKSLFPGMAPPRCLFSPARGTPRDPHY